MIFDTNALPLPIKLRADLVIVGSGAGGSTVAMEASAAGLSTVVLEAGGFIPPSSMTQREEQMLPRLLYANGGQVTSDKAVHIHQGRAVGGSTVHNINLCKRIPAPILDDWRRTRGLEHLPPERWAELYGEAEVLIGVRPVPRTRWNRHNRLLEAGCDQLGWKGSGLSHNRSGCAGSGFCLLGCAHDAKNNAVRVLLPRAIAAGTQVLTHCRAIRVLHDGSQVHGVEAVALDARTREPLGRVVVEAPRLCLSASATGTPALLLRSRVPDPGGETGTTLRIHPALVAAGVFAEPVRAWDGIPQTFECTEWLDFDAVHRGAEAPDEAGKRTWIVPAFAHPVGTATMMPGQGDAHRALMQQYEHLAVFTGMIHDVTVGTVRPSGDLEHRIDYWPVDADRRELAFGMAASARLLLAAGAERVVIPTDPPTLVRSPADADALADLDLWPHRLDITAVHPMGSVPMGDDPSLAAVDSRGAHHHVDGLWVADGSLFPSSIGGPPQLSIYALGLHVGRAIVASG